MIKKGTWKREEQKANFRIGSNKNIKGLSMLFAMVIIQLLAGLHANAQVQTMNVLPGGGGGTGGTPAPPGAIGKTPVIYLPVASTQYSCPALVVGTTTSWSISPGTAGTIIGNLNYATVTWNQSYTGTANIAVVAVNSSTGARSTPSNYTVTIISPVSPASQNISPGVNVNTISCGSVTGIGGFTPAYQWQSSPTGDGSGSSSASLAKAKLTASATASSTWTDVSGATNPLSFIPTTPTGNTYYHLKVTTNGTDYYSGQVVVNIYQSVINLNTIAIGSATSSIYPNGTVALYAIGKPTVSAINYQWQNLTDPNGTWTNITGATGTDYITPALTKTTSYQLVTSYNGSTGTSAPITVTVNTVGPSEGNTGSTPPPCNLGTLVNSPLSSSTLVPGQYYSNTGITLGPGFSADGANGNYTFVISPTCPITNSQATTMALPPSNPSDDLGTNWVMTRSYDENGNEIAASKAFFDYNGKATQAQSRSETTGQVLASQSVNDFYGRPVVSTLAAPINNSGFAYNANFVTANGSPYSYLNFDGDPTSTTNQYGKLNSPDAVDNTQQGTLGWYYSNNNTTEPMVATTGLPYSRSDYYHDGTGAVKRSAGVGEALSMGSGHETTSNSFPVQNELNQYLAIRNKFFPSATVGASPTSMAGQALQTIATDQNGLRGLSVTDLSGKQSLMTGRADPNGWLPITNSLTAIAVRPDFEITHTVNQFSNFAINSKQIIYVYYNGALFFTGTGNDFTRQYPSGLSQGTYLVTSSSRFSFTDTTSTRSLTDALTNNFVNVNAPFNESTNSVQYFLLTSPSTVSITGGAFTLYDMKTEQDITVSYQSNNSLPAGYYRVIATPPAANGTVASNTITISYTNKYADISFNYYNQLGQLIANIAPYGVQLILKNGISYYANTSLLPFLTTYQYDLQERLISSTSTDGGTSNFVYRTDGKIRFSQNSFQASTANNTTGMERFSYTNYDTFGRPTESGEYSAPTGTFKNLAANTTLLDITDGTLPVATATKLNNINTYYDVPTTIPNLTSYVQDPGFLKGAVSYTTGSVNNVITSSTWYNYDDPGRIAWTVKYINGLGYKTVDYTYNHQGNVTSVTYQKGASDQFIHYYAYDADGRLTNVQTSTDGISKTQQVNYYYYLHGPLKRTELGNQLQGIDYVYTPQGWLKAMNSPTGNQNNDPGQDGNGNGFAPDAFGMQLEYFPGDYARSGSNVTNIATGSGTNYYNGQVTGMSWQSNKPSSVISASGTGSNIQSPTMYTYTYDNKYQYTGATWGAPNASNTFTASSNNMFQEKGITYDFNGNIQSMQHTGSTGTLADNFTYIYTTNTNQLQKVTNAVGNNTYGTYTYDEIGRLKSQKNATGTTTYVKYDVTGKIVGIFADAAFTQQKVGYGYDEIGKRIKRTDYTGSQPITTYYMYDTNGTDLAIYTQTGSATPVETEVPFYGTGRLGTYFVASKNYVYEIRDIVGSVRVAVNGTKVSGQADIYKYDDYYPYGSVARSGGQTYRYDYQGAYAEKDPVTGYNNFELRMYDARIGRWLSTDPAGQHASPYEAMGNDPVTKFDKDGGCDGPGEPPCNVPQSNSNEADPCTIPNLVEKLPNGDLKMPDLKEVNVNRIALTWKEIYDARVSRGEDPFEGPNGSVIRKEYDIFKLLYSQSVPDVDGCMINGSLSLSILNMQYSGGLVRDNSTGKLHLFGSKTLYFNASKLTNIGASISFDQVSGYKNNSSVTFNDFKGNSVNFDATILVANFGYEKPLDAKMRPTNGYNIMYWGVGTGFNISGGTSYTTISK